MRTHLLPTAALTLAVALAGCGSSDTSATCSSGGAMSMRAPVAGFAQQGPSDAWVTIVEFSDFECPFCARVQGTLAALRAQYGNSVRVVFRNFPLSFHAMAMPAATAAECARLQGKFWEMHDWLFANQGSMSDSATFEAAVATEAAALALDVPAWQACRADPATTIAIQSDTAGGTQLAVRSTPTFAINGVPLIGAQPLSAFQCAVDAALARAQASGIPAASYYDRAVLGQ